MDGSAENDFKFIDTIPTCDEIIQEIRDDIKETGNDMEWLCSNGRKGSYGYSLQSIREIVVCGIKWNTEKSAE